MSVRILSIPWSWGRAAPIAIGGPPDPPFSPDFFVSTTGGTGTGAINDPWSYSYFITGAGGAVTAGKKIAMRGGTYGTPTSDWTHTFSGAAGNPVIVRNYQDERVIVNGSWRFGTIGGNNGQYIRYQGNKMNFVVYSSDPSQVSSNNIRGASVELINVIIHDGCHTGIFSSGVDTTLYGVISYNNGNYPGSPDHGYYLECYGTCKVDECVGFTNTNIGFQVDGGPASAYLETNGCISFGNSEIAAAGGGRNWFFNTGSDPATSASGGIFRQLYGYGINGGPGNGLENNRFSGWDNDTHGNGKLTIEDSILYGGVVIGRELDSSTLTVQRNKCYAVNLLSIYNKATPIAGFTVFDSNLWFKRGTSGTWSRLNLNGIVNNTADIAGWAANVAANTSPSYTPEQAGTYLQSTTGEPTSGKTIICRPNTYEIGRGHIAVYNWDDSSSVDIDISPIVYVGDRFTIRPMQRLWTDNSSHIPDTPVASGIYGGGTVNVPMNVTPLDPINMAGRGPLQSPRSMGPRFGCFLVLRE